MLDPTLVASTVMPSVAMLVGVVQPIGSLAFERQVTMTSPSFFRTQILTYGLTIMAYPHPIQLENIT